MSFIADFERAAGRVEVEIWRHSFYFRGSNSVHPTEIPPMLENRLSFGDALANEISSINLDAAYEGGGCLGGSVTQMLENWKD